MYKAIQSEFQQEMEDAYMNTWQMIKTLTEAKLQFKHLYFAVIDENEGISICYLRPNVGSIEFRFYNLITKILEMNPIIYPDEKWIEITEEEAKIYLGKNLYSIDIVE